SQRERRALRIDLDGHDVRRRLGERRRALAERRSDLRAPAPRSEHRQQPPDGLDRRAAAGHNSARGNERCRRGGTRKFWRCVVVSTELIPCARPRGGSSSFVPSGRCPSMANRLRAKSSLEGLKTTKCTPACASLLNLSRAGVAVHANGLSSVLKSARCGIAVPFGYTVPSVATKSCRSRDVDWIDALWPKRPVVWN